MPAMGDGGGGTAGLTADLVRGRHLDIPARPVSGRNRAPLLPEHGFDAAGLSAGSEVPPVTVVRAEPGRVSAPKYRALVVLCYDGICGAAHHIPAVLWHEHTAGIARSWSSGQAAARACPVLPSCWAQLSSAVVDAPAEVGAVPAGARVSVRGRHRLGPWRGIH